MIVDDLARGIAFLAQTTDLLPHDRPVDAIPADVPSVDGAESLDDDVTAVIHHSHL